MLAGVETWPSLTMEAMQDISNRALEIACKLQSVLMVGCGTAELKAEFLKWWDNTGKSLFHETVPRTVCFAMHGDARGKMGGAWDA